MSTKIYTGFRLTTSSWPEIHGHVMDFRQELQRSTYRESCRKVAARAAHFIDRRAIGLANSDASSDTPIVAASMEYMTEEREDPTQFSIVLIPYEGRVYGITFGEREAEGSWFARPFVEPWGYWNNTDQPDDVTDDEWDERRSAWDAMMGNDGVNMRGFTAECVSKYGGLPRANDVLSAIPGMDDRVRTLAIDTLFPEFLTETGEEPAHAFGGFLSWFRKDPDGRVAAEKERIRPLLAAEVTKGMLTGKG